MNKAPPQEFDLPLADGLSNGGGGVSTYWCNEFGEVSFILAVTTSKLLTNAPVVAVLPVGVRPSLLNFFCASSMSPDYARYSGASLNVNTNGEIRYHGLDVAAGGIIWGAGTFISTQ